MNEETKTNLLALANKFSYVMLVISFISGNVIWIPYLGLVLFILNMLLQVVLKRKLTYPSDILIVVSCLINIVFLQFVQSENFLPFIGTIFYLTFGVAFLMSLIIRRPYTAFYFLQEIRFSITFDKYHYLYTTLWIIIFSCCIFASIAWASSVFGIFMPILFLLIGYLLINIYTARVCSSIKHHKSNDFNDMPEALSISDIFEGMLNVFDPSAVPGLRALIQYQISGNESGEWYFDIKKGAINLNIGHCNKPDLTISTDCDTWHAIAVGKISGEQAFMSGKLTGVGNMELLVQQDQIFNRGAENE